MGLLSWIKSKLQRRKKTGRSPHWPTVRRAWLKHHGQCEACGGTDHLEVHHVIPFSVDPDMELSALAEASRVWPTVGPGQLPQV